MAFDPVLLQGHTPPPSQKNSSSLQTVGAFRGVFQRAKKNYLAGMLTAVNSELSITLPMRLSDLLVLPSAAALLTSFTGHWFLIVPVTSSADGWGWDSYSTVPYVSTAGSSWVDNTELSFQIWAFIVFNLTESQVGSPAFGWNSDATWANWKLGAPSPPGLGNSPTAPVGGYGELGPYAGRAFLCALAAGLVIRAFTSDYDVPLPFFD